MKVVCAWCNKELGEKEPLEDTSITHSICDECKNKYFKEIKDAEANTKEGSI